MTIHDINDIKHYRNGTSGQGFTRVLFTATHDLQGTTETLLAILPNDNGDYKEEECYVVNPLNPNLSYRGDNIAKILIPRINEQYPL